MVGGNAGLIGMSKEHLGVALALNVPIAVCVTKVGSVPSDKVWLTVDRHDPAEYPRTNGQYVDQGAQVAGLQTSASLRRQHPTGCGLRQVSRTTGGTCKC